MIDLSSIVYSHEATTIDRHKRLLEELFYLCLNEPFNESIEAFRESIFNKLSVEDSSLPRSHEEALSYRNRLHAQEHKYWYLNECREISRRHNYVHPSFVRDYLSLGTDTEVQSRFNILENIIFYNTPIGPEDTREHYGTSSGYMEIADDDPEGPYIKISFDIGTTKRNIIDIIDKQFPEITNIMSDRYRIPDVQRFTPDNRMLEKLRIYELTNEGKSDLEIGTRLYKEGLSEEGQTDEAIKSIKRRASNKISRFDPVA